MVCLFKQTMDNANRKCPHDDYCHNLTNNASAEPESSKAKARHLFWIQFHLPPILVKYLRRNHHNASSPYHVLQDNCFKPYYCKSTAKHKSTFNITILVQDVIPITEMNLERQPLLALFNRTKTYNKSTVNTKRLTFCYPTVAGIGPILTSMRRQSAELTLLLLLWRA
jgi:hypothetical protein